MADSDWKPLRMLQAAIRWVITGIEALDQSPGVDYK